MPELPPARLAERRKTRQLDVGGVLVGGGAPISVQSMTTTVTADVNATLQQIAELTATGCQIVRVAVPDPVDAEALPRVVKQSQIPVIADIHFQSKYIFAAIDAGCAAVRVNPGNIREFDGKVGEVAKRGQGGRHPDPDRRQRRQPRQADPGEARQGHAGGAGRVGAVGVLAVRGARLPRHQDLGQAQRPGRDGAGLPAAAPSSATTRCTSASPRPDRPSRARSSRRSPSGRCSPRASATRSASRCRRRRSRRSRSAWRSSSRSTSGSAGSRSCRCPSCGRAQVDVYTLAEQVTAGLEGLTVPLRVAVMGCVVNGPGEAREADLGVASGNGKGQIFVKGEVIKTVPESQIVETLIEEAMRLAEEYDGPSRRTGGRHQLTLVPCVLLEEHSRLAAGRNGSGSGVRGSAC